LPTKFGALLINPLNSMNCPHCQRLLYNRKLKNCGFCGEELPPECLFTEEELAEIDARMDAIEQQFRQAQSAENIPQQAE
jgi:predicted  nucleic acid-binding Zn-ribbon protein